MNLESLSVVIYFQAVQEIPRILYKFFHLDRLCLIPTFLVNNK